MCCVQRRIKMPKKNKVPKYQQAIANAQAISATSQKELTREQWWEMLRAVQPGDYESLKTVINTKCPSAYPDTDASKTQED